jgi:hypothetical protein
MELGKLTVGTIRRGGFALSPPARRVWKERRVVMATELEPEQFEHVPADLLLRLASPRRLQEHGRDA